MAVSKEIKIGIIGMVVLFLSIYIFNWIKQNNLLTVNMIVTAKFDRLNFLKKGHPVFVNGQQLGEVAAVYKDGNAYFADLDMDPYVKIPKSAKAAIMDASLLGGRAVYIFHEGTCENNCLVDGDQIEGYVEGTKEQIEAAAKPILKGFEKFANQFMDDTSGVSAMLDAAYASAANLKKTTDGLKGTLGQTAKTFPQNMASLRKMTSDVSANFVADEAQQSAIDSLLATMSSITQEDIDAMTEILYTANEKLPAVPTLVDKAQAAIGKVDGQMDKVNAKLATFEPGNENIIAKMLHDEDFKDSLQIKIRGISVKLGDIRKNPEKYLSLKKNKK